MTYSELESPRALAAGRSSRVAVLVCLLAAACTSRPDPAVDLPSGWPVSREACKISSVFGARRGSGRHQGLDLSAPAGTKVRSTAAGTVTFAGTAGDWGRMVIVDHGGGWQTRYAHLRRVDVAAGTRISRGRRLGTIGRSGNATGFHLHYEVRHENRPLDPRKTMYR